MAAFLVSRLPLHLAERAGARGGPADFPDCLRGDGEDEPGQNAEDGDEKHGLILFYLFDPKGAFKITFSILLRRGRGTRLQFKHRSLY